MKYLGIDPGITGALAIIDSETEGIAFLDTPILEIKGAKKTTHVIDTAEIVNMLMRAIGRCANVTAVIEKVSAAPISFGKRMPCPACGKLPQQGATSMFHFGEGFGIWQGVLAGLQIPYSLVAPRTWKSQLMRDQGKEKSASIIRAKQLYPQAAASLTLKKHHGRGDALLLAHYGKMFLSGSSIREPEPLAETPLFASF